MINDPHPPSSSDDRTNTDEKFPPKWEIKSVIIPIIFILLATCLYSSFNRKPDPTPTLIITDARIPSFSHSFTGSTIYFTFTFAAAVTNPTPFIFSYPTSYLHLFYSGRHVGSTYVLSSLVGSGQVYDFTVSMNDLFISRGFFQRVIKPTANLDLELRLKLQGKLHNHHRFQIILNCRIAVASSNGSLLHVNCDCNKLSKVVIPYHATPPFKKKASNKAVKTLTNAADEGTRFAPKFEYATRTPDEGRAVKLDSARTGRKELHMSIQENVSLCHPAHENKSCQAKQCMSFNATEFINQLPLMENESEVDSEECDSSMASVRGYNVKPESVNLLNSILDKYGDIGDNCLAESSSIRSFYMQCICDFVEKLMNFSCSTLFPEEEVANMLVFLKDAGNARFEVGWLVKRLKQIREAKQALIVLKPPSELKKLYAEQDAKIRSKKLESAICKRAIDMHQRQIHNLQEKINSADYEVSVCEKEALESKNAIDAYKEKLRTVFELNTLAHGLLPD